MRHPLASSLMKNLDNTCVAGNAVMDMSSWTSAHVADIAHQKLPETPVISKAQASPVIAGLDLWDMWPLQLRDGSVASIAGGELWFVLSAPQNGDPVNRHKKARIRLLHCANGEWTDQGNALPNGFTPGSREWSGSAVFDSDADQVTLFFTAAGRRDELILSAEQRLFQATAYLTFAGNVISLQKWSALQEMVASDGIQYVIVNQVDGEPGTIKAFRDPAHFHDPADGHDYVIFATSLAQSASAFNGSVGIARATNAKFTGWHLLPPLISADTVNNEMERPHLIMHGGLYYLFWSTQAHTFNPDGPKGPNGLYGMVAPSLFGPYAPLNGTGLVLCNPAEEPYQAYSWQVLTDLRVIAFVDSWGRKGADVSDPVLARAHFGGTPAPVQHLRLDGPRSFLNDGR
jgi:levansucrase